MQECRMQESGVGRCRDRGCFQDRAEEADDFITELQRFFSFYFRQVTCSEKQSEPEFGFPGFLVGNRQPMGEIPPVLACNPFRNICPNRRSRPENLLRQDIFTLFSRKKLIQKDSFFSQIKALVQIAFCFILFSLDRTNAKR